MNRPRPQVGTYHSGCSLLGLTLSAEPLAARNTDNAIAGFSQRGGEGWRGVCMCVEGGGREGRGDKGRRDREREEKEQ